MPSSSKKRGPKSGADKGKAAAANDAKQTVLSGMFTLVAKLPAALPPRPQGLPKPTYKPHPLGRPRPEADNVILLEVNACVHRVIDIIVIEHEKETLVIETECRTLLNAIIDQLVCMEARDPYFNLKATRVRYSQSTKRKVIALVQHASCSQGITTEMAVKQLKRVSGYEKVASTSLRKWQKAEPSNKRGRKVCSEFEAQIISQSIFTSFSKVDAIEVAVIEANVAHSYAVIKQAAEVVQKFPAYLSNQVVQNLKFSSPWVKGFLGRAALRRRRVTASEKVIPAPDVVRAKMTRTAR